MFMRGSSDASGSWKISCRCRRIACRREPESCSRFSPRNSALPDSALVSRSSARAMLDFPLPDSPTIARVSPRARSKLTPSTARSSACASACDAVADAQVAHAQQRGGAERAGPRCPPALPHSPRHAASQLAQRAFVVAGLPMPRLGFNERRRDRLAHWHAIDAAWSKRATGRQRRRVRRRAADARQPRRRRRIEPRDAVLQAFGVGMARVREQFLATVACSTMRPAYITATRSATSAITPRSCVTSTIAVPVRARSSWNRLRICACTVTSSAVLGSSASSISGSAISAMAIITRWRMPPDSSWGYWRMRRAPSGMCTASSISIARCRAVRASLPRCTRSTSVIWRPIVR